MLITGALDNVDNLHMEWHGEASFRKGREPAMISKLAPAITAIGENIIDCQEYLLLLYSRPFEEGRY